MPSKKPPAPRAEGAAHADLGQISLVLQGGGALGAYQAGCYQALSEAGMEPDWVIGTSIGAINAAIIAGNKPEDRIEKLRTLWQRLEFSGMTALTASLPLFGGPFATWMTMMTGLDNFFVPNPTAFTGAFLPMDPEKAGYYTTDRLRTTLGDLIDFDRIDAGQTRLMVGAACVGTGEMRYFDSRDERVTLDHVMASGALPPAFPAVRIDGELYWDGGILSNTPVEAIFDDRARRSGVVFAVHMWNPEGPEPKTMVQVVSRQKDLQYASRSLNQIRRQRELHRLRHVVAELARELPAELRQTERVAMLASYGCLTRMHIVRLLAPSVGNDDHSKDIDFSPASIKARWDAGYRDTAEVVGRAPWREPCDPLEGFVLHEFASKRAMRTG